MIAVFQSNACLLSLCFGPILLAAVSILVHYVGLWRLTRRFPLDSTPVKQYRTTTGRLIIWVLLLPIPLVITHFIVNEAIVFPMQLAQARTRANTLVQAIEAFNARTGEYPVVLDELAPVELETVPALPGGGPFGYQSGGDWYSLTYSYIRIAPITCRYSSGALGWYCD